MRGRFGAVILCMGLVLPASPVLAQDFDYGGDHTFDRRPPPPPPPPDRDYGPGYRRPPREGDYGDDRRRRRFDGDHEYRRDFGELTCRTPEGSCRSAAPPFLGARCRCDFGDGPVRGRMRP